MTYSQTVSISFAINRANQQLKFYKFTERAILRIVTKNKNREAGFADNRISKVQSRSQLKVDFRSNGTTGTIAPY